MTFEEVNLQNSDASLIPGEVLSVSDAGSGYERCDAKIYICATMWHETEAEMEELVESLLRCDADPFVNGYNFNSNDKSKETYQLKAHIVFDDALVPAKCVPGHSTINCYAQSLLNVLNRLVNHPITDTRTVERNGVWSLHRMRALPNGSTLYLHLKDKTKVRIGNDGVRFSAVVPRG
ncbi:PREDICTED: uncharacterized protein LOC106818957 [Priapulus caudatus]|uniref:Uncharacterized protein LOC106818957 n=1 Tax=Priapulus caudatus TaxID=37621 RepID=A0ABM1F3T8_PRICU|nr:PREDICTED: uncharacterized protein LOC106818957 [Priapulus caudatus]